MLKFAPCPDFRISELAQAGMITPFEPQQVKAVDGGGVISFGLGYFGYDIRVGNEFKLVDPDMHNVILDPKRPDENQWLDIEVEDFLDIPPHSFVLARSMEYMQLPQNVLGLVLGKSTYARCGLIANFTPLEPGWNGYIVIELTNATSLFSRVYVGEGIAQILFFEGVNPHAGYTGKYQNQQGIQLATVTAPPLSIKEAVAGVQRAAEHFRIDLLECQCGSRQTARTDEKSVVCVRCGSKLR